VTTLLSSCRFQRHRPTKRVQRRRHPSCQTSPRYLPYPCQRLRKPFYPPPPAPPPRPLPEAAAAALAEPSAPSQKTRRTKKTEMTLILAAATAAAELGVNHRRRLLVDLKTKPEGAATAVRTARDSRLTNGATLAQLVGVRGLATTSPSGPAVAASTGPASTPPHRPPPLEQLPQPRPPPPPLRQLLQQQLRRRQWAAAAVVFHQTSRHLVQPHPRRRVVSCHHRRRRHRFFHNPAAAAGNSNCLLPTPRPLPAQPARPNANHKRAVETPLPKPLDLHGYQLVCSFLSLTIGCASFHSTKFPSWVARGRLTANTSWPTSCPSKTSPSSIASMSVPGTRAPSKTLFARETTLPWTLDTSSQCKRRRHPPSQRPLF